MTEEGDVIRRYLGVDAPNMDSYRADPLTCRPIPNSFRPKVTREGALAALRRLEASKPSS